MAHRHRQPPFPFTGDCSHVKSSSIELLSFRDASDAVGITGRARRLGTGRCSLAVHLLADREKQHQSIRGDRCRRLQRARVDIRPVPLGIENSQVFLTQKLPRIGHRRRRRGVQATQQEYIDQNSNGSTRSTRDPLNDSSIARPLEPPVQAVIRFAGNTFVSVGLSPYRRLRSIEILE